MKPFKLLLRAMPIAVIASISFRLGALSRPSAGETEADASAVAEVHSVAALELAPVRKDPPRKPAAAGKSIRNLTEHFNEPGADISPWIFVPDENIKEFSTGKHPGLATIYEAGKGQDIKGILKDPIRINDFRLPWEFQTSFVQSFNAQAGVDAKTQVNYAIGLNVAVTFSDPTTWPKNRLERPPQTHDFRLLVVHLGCTGEAFDPRRDCFRGVGPSLKRGPISIVEREPVGAGEMVAA
ncbi:MAG TPA: hypothetical protein VND64_04520 [Pirellulales bacterium]|nr:hypothetical protein [Pirellulales bacterium]